MPWIDIRREDARYYTNVTQSGDKFQALVGLDGIRPENLTAAGRKHFGIGNESSASAKSSSSSSSKKSSSKSSSSKSSSSGGGVLSAIGKAAFGSDKKEEREPEPLTAAERRWLEMDIEDNYDPEPHVYIKNVVTQYYKVHKLSPEIDSECDWRDDKLDEILDFMVEFPIPEEPIEFFMTLLTLECIYREKSESDAIFGGWQATKRTQNVLFLRMRKIAYGKDNPEKNPIYAQEVLDFIWDFDNFSEEACTVLYSTVAEYACKKLQEKGDTASLKELLSLYERRKSFSAKYLGKFVIPNSNKEEFLEAFRLITSYKNLKDSAVKKKLIELKEIILANYSDDAELMVFVEQQQERELREKAKVYKIIKYVSLPFCILFSFVTLFIPLIIWLIVFITPLHNKISFLREGKNAVESVKRIDAKRKS